MVSVSISGVTGVTTDLLKYFIAQPEAERDHPVFVEMQADTLLILSCICDMDMHRKVRDCHTEHAQSRIMYCAIPCVLTGSVWWLRGCWDGDELPEG